MKAILSSGAIAFVVVCASASGCLSSDDVTTGTKESATIPRDPPPCMMTVGTETAPQDKVVVSSPDFLSTDCFGSCQVRYVQGDNVTLDIPFPTDYANCIAFSGWTGACAGQGSTCHTYCSDHATIIAQWSTFAGGCNPD